MLASLVIGAVVAWLLKPCKKQICGGVSAAPPSLSAAVRSSGQYGLQSDSAPTFAAPSYNYNYGGRS